MRGVLVAKHDAKTHTHTHTHTHSVATLFVAAIVYPKAQLAYMRECRGSNSSNAHCTPKVHHFGDNSFLFALSSQLESHRNVRVWHSEISWKSTPLTLADSLSKTAQPYLRLLPRTRWVWGRRCLRCTSCACIRVYNPVSGREITCQNTRFGTRCENL